MFCSIMPNATGTQILDGIDQIHAVGQVFKTSYLQTETRVTISNTLSHSVASLGLEGFADSAKPLTYSQLNKTAFEAEFMRQVGATHLQPTLGQSHDMFAQGVNNNYWGTVSCSGRDAQFRYL